MVGTTVGFNINNSPVGKEGKLPSDTVFTWEYMLLCSMGFTYLVITLGTQ